VGTTSAKVLAGGDRRQKLSILSYHATLSLTSDAHERGPQDRPFAVAVPDVIHRFGDPEASFVSGIEEEELLGQVFPREAGDAYADESDGAYREFVQQSFGESVDVVLETGRFAEGGLTGDREEGVVPELQHDHAATNAVLPKAAGDLVGEFQQRPFDETSVVGVLPERTFVAHGFVLG